MRHPQTLCDLGARHPQPAQCRDRHDPLLGCAMRDHARRRAAIVQPRLGLPSSRKRRNHFESVRTLTPAASAARASVQPSCSTRPTAKQRLRRHVLALPCNSVRTLTPAASAARASVQPSCSTRRHSSSAINGGGSGSRRTIQRDGHAGKTIPCTRCLSLAQTNDRVAMNPGQVIRRPARRPCQFPDVLACRCTRRSTQVHAPTDQRPAAIVATHRRSSGTLLGTGGFDTPQPPRQARMEQPS